MKWATLPHLFSLLLRLDGVCSLDHRRYCAHFLYLDRNGRCAIIISKFFFYVNLLFSSFVILFIIGSFSINAKESLQASIVNIVVNVVGIQFEGKIWNWCNQPKATSICGYLTRRLGWWSAPIINDWNVNLLFFIFNIKFWCFYFDWVAVCNVNWGVVRKNSYCFTMVLLLNWLPQDIVLTCSQHSKLLFLYILNER